MKLLPVPIVLALLAQPAAGAETLGRLFFTPDQRAALDAARSKKTRVNLETEKPEEVAAPVPEVVTYGGLVRRSDGKTTVWLNRRAINEKDKASGAIVGRIRPDGRVTVQSPQTGRNVDLKVGQSAELLSGSVEEGYARRRPGSQPASTADSKSAGKPAANPTASEKSPEERARERDVEDTLRALQGAAAKSVAPAQPPQEPSR